MYTANPSDPSQLGSVGVRIQPVCTFLVFELTAAAFSSSYIYSRRDRVLNERNLGCGSESGPVR